MPRGVVWECRHRRQLSPAARHPLPASASGPAVAGGLCALSRRVSLVSVLSLRFSEVVGTRWACFRVRQGALLRGVLGILLAAQRCDRSDPRASPTARLPRESVPLVLIGRNRLYQRGVHGNVSLQTLAVPGCLHWDSPRSQETRCSQDSVSQLICCKVILRGSQRKGATADTARCCVQCSRCSLDKPRKRCVGGRGLSVLPPAKGWYEVLLLGKGSWRG